LAALVVAWVAEGEVKVKRRHFLRTAPLVGLLPNALHAQAAYPTKPIRYIVPVAAGGGNDLIARTVTERWARQLGGTFVVENIGGGGGSIASVTVAKAAPDGYTLMQGYVATHATSPATRKLNYDPIKDFTPIGMIGGTPNVLVVPAALPVADLKQFIEHVLANPGKLNYGSAGVGSLTHMTMELFKQAIHGFIVHVPYRGIAPAFTDLLGGQTQAMFPGLAAAMPHIRSGRVRPLAVTGAARHALFRDLPTLIESGFKGFDALQWYGAVGPAGMAPDVVKLLNDTLNKTLAGTDMSDKLSSEAVQTMPMSPEQFAQYIRADLARWTELAQERRIQVDG
jgi:tripartite-type tricarboxylate transporter receptor subunit TctC